MHNLSPAYDNKIYQKYSKKMLHNKEKNKMSFCQDFGLEYNKKSPLLCLTFSLNEKNNLAMLQDVIHGILEQEVNIAVIGVGTQKYQDFFNELAKNYPRKISIVNENDGNKRKVYAASDMFLATSSNDECQEEMKNAMNYGVVPISPLTKWVNDYNGAKEEGNAFAYKEKSPWSFFASLIRAIENFKFPYDWRVIQASAMSDNEATAEDEEMLD